MRLFVCDDLSLMSNMFDILRRDTAWIKTVLKTSVASQGGRRVGQYAKVRQYAHKQFSNERLMQYTTFSSDKSAKVDVRK